MHICLISRLLILLSVMRVVLKTRITNPQSYSKYPICMHFFEKSNLFCSELRPIYKRIISKIVGFCSTKNIEEYLLIERNLNNQKQKKGISPLIHFNNIFEKNLQCFFHFGFFVSLHHITHFNIIKV